MASAYRANGRRGKAEGQGVAGGSAGPVAGGRFAPMLCGGAGRFGAGLAALIRREKAIPTADAAALPMTAVSRLSSSPVASR